MKQNIPSGTKIVVEPIAPDQWATDAGHPIFEDQGGTGSGNRWNKWRTSRSCFFNGKQITSGACPVVKLEDYERTTRPDLVGNYEGRLLLGRHRLDAVRPCVRGPEGRPDALRTTTSSSSQARSSSASSPYGRTPSACRSRSTPRSTTTR